MAEGGGAGAEGGARSGAIEFTEHQLRTKFKHAHWFGITGSFPTARAVEYAEALRRHVDASETVVVHATFRRTIEVKLYVNSETGLMVMVDVDGHFISAWRLNDDQLRNVMHRRRP